MAHIWKDFVLETSTTTGTGALTLAGAVTGYRAFSAVCATSDTVYYFIQAVDGSGVPTGDWETGLGTYSASNTLTRTTVVDSSNSGSAVSFGAGTKRVGMCGPASVSRNPAFPAPHSILPAAASFTAVHGSGATLADGTDGLVLTAATTGSSTNQKLYKKSAPSAPFSVIAKVSVLHNRTNYAAGGICVRNSSNGRYISIAVETNTAHQIAVYKYTGVTAFSASLVQIGAFSNFFWFKINLTGTTLTFSFSEDGKNWRDAASEALATFLTTADEIGVVCECASTSAHVVYSQFRTE